MTDVDRRLTVTQDRRRAPRGGRRASDRQGRHPTVLIAHGYEDLRFPLVRYLDHFGFRVIEASSADEATQLLDSQHPEVVLSGLQAEQAARLYEELGERRSPAAPMLIALLSGIDDRTPPLATGVLRMPFTLRSMLDEVRRGLGAAARSDGPASAL